MPTVLQFRRGTTSQNNAFTGAIGEVTYDTTVDTLRVHDGSTAGGFSVVSATSTDTLTNKTLTSPVVNTATVGTSIVPASADGATLGTAAVEWSDLYLADGGITYFGNDQDVKLTHNADKGLILKHTATGAAKPVSLTLQTGEIDIAASDVIGSLNFQAPDEGTGTDAILVAAGIDAVSEGDFSSTNNATKLVFKTAASEAAASKMVLSSGGNLTVSGDLTITGDDLFMATNTSGAALIADGTNYNPVVISGDISINTSGVAAIGSGVIVSADIAADTIAESNMANDAIGSAELKTLATLLIKNSAGSTLKTVYGAGA
jgi:hypothetical protein